MTARHVEVTGPRPPGVRTFFQLSWRLIRSLPLLLVLPFLAGVPLLAIAISDLLQLSRKRIPANSQDPSSQSASVVIPNWNGRDLLERYLPSVIEALQGCPGNEIVVVDNGSTDGSAEYLRAAFPAVRVIALEKNLGFGGGSNAGFREARNDIVVLLNSDMRVDPKFLAPLLEGFSGGNVFAVSCQIFFSDSDKVREETGLTQAWWETGGLRVRHRLDDAIQSAYPCFYGGGGSCAFDRSKFLELGGFDHTFAPFYLEDTDLGYLAWKRGWKVLYEPRSIVFHEHRGTIGKNFSAEHINRVLKKNFILFCWKNIHEWPRLASYFFYTMAGAGLSLLFGDSPERANLAGLWGACLQLPGALRSRSMARSLAVITDTEAFRRPLAGYFRDRFETLPANPGEVGVLFISPYPILPPIHGGAVFMSQTVKHLLRQTRLNLIILLDHEWEREPHRPIERDAVSVEYLVRMEGVKRELGSISPHAVTEFANPDLEWLIHRQIYTQRIDVVQIEYTALAQYALDFNQIACILFEHDVYFQSIGRQLPQMHGAITKIKAAFEYLRAIRFELGILPRFDRVQVCSPANAAYLAGFRPELAPRIDAGLRAGIDTGVYDFQLDGREPYTMLFLGSFRHTPNQAALNWFVAHILPKVLARRPDARLVVVGSEPPPRHSLPDLGQSIELRGFVEDVHEPLRRYALFVCPILAGSGMRVKLLEAFASGIPVVSTRLGAEGLAINDGEFCSLADTPDTFAEHLLALFEQPEMAQAMALRARHQVERTRDMAVITDLLVENYRAVLKTKRASQPASPRSDQFPPPPDSPHSMM
jgi:GT2 family glycosyltransferase